MKYFVVVFSFFTLAKAQGQNENVSLEKFYNNILLGEKKTKNYSGPIDPRSSFSKVSGDLDFLDDKFQENIFNSSIQDESFELSKFWFENISLKSTCPDGELGANIDYIRYLYRLVSISYLYESIKINNRILSELGETKSYCKLSYAELFSNCNPQTLDMQKFKHRVQGKFVNEIEKLKFVPMSKKEIQIWLDLFHKSTIQNTDPSITRLHRWCLDNQKKCDLIKIEEIKSTLNNFCVEDKKLLSDFCSEKDDLYGVSYAPILTTLIQSSNAFNVLNANGMGEECLHRYVHLNTPKEFIYPNLEKIFSSINLNLQKEGSRYLQGDLFLPGALKEFDVKGLSDFLTALRVPKVVIAKKRAVVKSKPIVRPVIVEKPIVVESPKPIEPIVINEIEMPKITEFESAVLTFNKNPEVPVIVDMEKFRSDYEFTSKMISDLSKPIKKFQTRDALSDMKNYDHLGNNEAPLGLLFIKFLIDTENHQGLFNVVNVIGSKFYVHNDFEHKKDPIFIELKNDVTTNNKWTIILVKKEPEKVIPKKEVDEDLDLPKDESSSDKNQRNKKI